MTAAAALALGMGPALAADEAPGASSDITIVDRDAGNAPGSNVQSSGSSENEGSLSAPEKNAPATPWYDRWPRGPIVANVRR
jgi:hypothetical protein